MNRDEWIDEMAYRASLVAAQYEESMNSSEKLSFRTLLNDYVTGNEIEALA